MTYRGGAGKTARPNFFRRNARMAKKSISGAKKGEPHQTTPKPAKSQNTAISDGGSGKPPALRFSGGGWCEELRCSYFPGIYQPRDWREHDALKPYAEG